MIEREIKIPIEDAAIYAKKFVAPVIAIFTIPYLVYHHGFFYLEIKSYCYFYELYSALQVREGMIRTLFSPVTSLFDSFEHFGLLILSLFPAIILHEFLHALAIIAFSRGNLKAISFGFDKKTLSPYTHCRLPLYVWQYRVVLVLPGIILGILPGILGIALKSPELLIFGIMFTFGALGDYLMLTVLRGYYPKTKVKDHPASLGFFIIE